MKKYFLFILMISSCTIKAQTLVIDDFKTGAITLSETSVFDSKNQCGPHFQTGSSIIGGTRRIIYSKGPNPYNQKMAISILTNPGIFVLSSGYKAMNSVDLSYGLNSKNESNKTHIDLTKYKNLNIEFDGISHVLNFNIVLFSNPNSAQAQWGENFGHADNAFIRTIPISKLWNTHQPNFNPKDVGSITFLFNAATAVWGGEVGVKRIWFD